MAWAQLAQQRVGAAAGAAAGAAWPAAQATKLTAWGVRPGAKPAASSTYVVSCKGPDAEEMVVKTLVGEFEESGANHERKVFKKGIDQGKAGTVDVFMYYWDARDGPSFQGWWFGNQVGGSQVWSHNASESMMPPTSGWKIPWDGKIRPSILVQPKAQQPAMIHAERVPPPKGVLATAAAGASVSRPGMLAQVTPAQLSAGNEATQAAKMALEEARTMAGDYTDPDMLGQAEVTLVQQAAELNTGLKEAMEAARGAGVGPNAKQLQQNCAAMRMMIGQVNAELTKVKGTKARAEQAAKQKDKDSAEMASFEATVAEAEDKANNAEDTVEKAVITSEMIAAAGEDMDEVNSAVALTEQTVNEATKALGEARIFLNAKQASARRLTSQSVREHATTVLGKLQTQLQEANNKLTPLKTVRQDFQQKAQAQKVVEEILERLTPAELEVDRAEEACMLLDNEKGSRELQQQAEQSVHKASEALGAAMKFLEQKKRQIPQGPGTEEITKIEDRARASQTRLTELKNSRKEATERVTCVAVQEEAQAKLVAVEKAVDKATDAEGPFLMGVEELPIKDTMEVIKNCEAALASANTAVSICKMFIATKLVEAKRFSKGPSEETTAKLKELQEALGVQVGKLNELKGNTAERKSKSAVHEAEQTVVKAEELAAKVAEHAAPFDNDEKLFALSVDDIKKAAAEVSEAEKVANQALADARKFITARQLDAKGRDSASSSSSELIKYQTRLSTAQAEVSKYKKMCTSVESRLAVKKTIEEATKKMAEAEEKIQGVESMIEALGKPVVPEDPEAEAEGKEAKEDEVAKKEADTPEKRARAVEKAAAEASNALKHAFRYLEMQIKRAGSGKDELEKLQPRLDKAQVKIDSVTANMKEKTEKFQVASIVEESEQRVATAEANVKQVGDVEALLLKGDEVPLEELSQILQDLEAATSAATTSVGGTKTFLAMKRLAAKRLSDASKESTMATLTTLQERLDATSKELQDAKKGMIERRATTVKREVVAIVAGVQKKVDAAQEATADLLKEEELTPEKMKSKCELAGTTQSEAQTAAENAKLLLLSRQRDAKAAATEANKDTLTEIIAQVDALKKLQAALDLQKNDLNEREHMFVSQRLQKDATDMVEKLDKAYEATCEQASILTAEKMEGITAVIYLQNIIEVLRQYMKGEKKTSQELWAEIGENTGKIVEAQFLAFVTKALAREENKDAFFSEEQQKQAFGVLAREGGPDVVEEDFLEQFRLRYLVTEKVSMTDTFAVKGGKAVRKLEVNELVEALEEPAKEDTAGILRIKAKTEKDGLEGFISLSGNQGTVYLTPFSAFTATRKEVEKAVAALGVSAKEAMKFMDVKADELKAIRTGPLRELKDELLKMRPRIAKVQHNQADLRKKVAASEKKLNEIMEAEKRKRLESAERKANAVILDAVSSAVEALQAEVEKALPTADAFEGVDDPLAAMDKADKDLDGVLVSVAKTLSLVKEKMETTTAGAKGVAGDLRAALVKHKVAATTCETKCKKQVAFLRSARKQAADAAHTACTVALRAHAQKIGAGPDALFKEMSEGSDEVSLEKLKAFFGKLPDCPKASQLDMGLMRYKAGLSKLVLLDILQEYLQCVKEIALTTSFEVKDSKTIRKLALDEYVEVLESGKVDEAVGLARVRCRALGDGVEGWVTLKGNQGTAFVEQCGKPFYCCKEPGTLVAAFETGSDAVRDFSAGEVFEVLEGPRRGAPTEVQRVKGKAKKDGKVGWVTLADGSASFLEKVKLYVCKQGIAITTTFDIVEGKAIRKLDPAETLESLEPEQKDEKRSLIRMRVKATRDGQEGWITLKGNQGTAYAEVNEKLYECTRDMALEARLITGSTVVRLLEKGELFEATEGPKTDVKEGSNRVKARILADGTEGWFTLTAKNMTTWSPRYRCVSTTVLHDGLSVETAEVLRKLETGETFQALATPEKEASSGLMRIKVSADKDGKVGYATVKGDQGTVFLEPVTAGPGPGAASGAKKQ